MVFFHVTFGSDHVSVRLNRSVVQKKWLVFVGANKVECFRMSQIGRVVFLLTCHVAPQKFSLIVVPQKCGVVRVSYSLAVVAVEAIETHLQGITVRTRVAKSPLSKTARPVACIF